MSLKRYTLTAPFDEEWQVGFPSDDGPEVNEARDAIRGLGIRPVINEEDAGNPMSGPPV